MLEESRASEVSGDFISQLKHSRATLKLLVLLETKPVKKHRSRPLEALFFIFQHLRMIYDSSIKDGALQRVNSGLLTLFLV